MDFLEKATKKLDVADKLPEQVRDKLPGQGKEHRGEGGHLAQANRSHDDDGGFPQGLRPSDWMGDLVDKGMFPRNAKVTQFIIPGSHDAATYGSGLESFSYQCQEKNFYDQMMTGQRCFDLRLAKSEDADKFIPVHGIAKNTADDFNSAPKKAEGNDLAAQIMRFAKEHPKEILILQIRVENWPQVTNEFRDTVWALLGDRLLECPEKPGQVPTYEEAVRSNRNIVIALGVQMPGHPMNKHIWKLGEDTNHWIGDGNQMLWNEPTWQSGEVSKVIQSTEEFMQKNQGRTGQRDKFWVAFMQLTPVLGQSIGTFIKEGGSVRPKDLALGGGFGTHGEFKGSNKELRDSGIFKKALWQQHASCVLYDFCDTHTTGAIVAMNIGAHADNDGGERPGGFDGGHEGPGRGGRGGGRGGRGGRGGHGEGPERRDDDDDDDDGPRGGRGGHRGGRGRGEHRGGRGRED